MDQETQDFYTVDEVARRLCISNALVYREIRRGNLHARRIGGRVLRISTQDLKAYLQYRQTGVYK